MLNSNRLPIPRIWDAWKHWNQMYVNIEGARNLKASSTLGQLSDKPFGKLISSRLDRHQVPNLHDMRPLDYNMVVLLSKKFAGNAAMIGIAIVGASEFEHTPLAAGCEDCKNLNIK